MNAWWYWVPWVILVFLALVGVKRLMDELPALGCLAFIIFSLIIGGAALGAAVIHFAPH